MARPLVYQATTQPSRHTLRCGFPPLPIPRPASSLRLERSGPSRRPCTSRSHEPTPVPASRRMIVSRSFLASTGDTVMRLSEGDVIDCEAGFFKDLVKQFPQNFKRDVARADEA